MAAASVILILSIGVFILLNKKQSLPITAQTQVHDIAPGSNKAVLTLGNGQQIVLNRTRNGQLAVQGQVSINKTNEGEIVYNAPSNNNEAPVYNTVTTPRGGQYHLILADGTEVWLNAASSIKYPSAFTANSRNVEITGEAYFEVSHNKAKPFRVTSNGQMVQVLGTHFNINAYNDEPSIKTTLIEGSVRVSMNKQMAMLKPGQQSAVTNSGASISVTDHADTEQILAWKNGEFNFNEADVKTVMRQIGRWYDVEVEYAGNNIPGGHITGTFSRNLNASKALKLLEFTGVNFKIEGRKIIVK
jgi:ferric-dicitrate binding protein FerR (iron transport regulator)